jgi:hypothetical protein
LHTESVDPTDPTSVTSTTHSTSTWSNNNQITTSWSGAADTGGSGLHGYSVLVRDFSRVPGLEDCLRVTVGTADQVERFLEAMDKLMASRRASEHFGMAAVASRHQDDEE